MALRKTIFAIDQIYHIYNRGVNKRLIFLNKRDYTRIFDLTDYYRFVNCPIKFSYFKKLSLVERGRILENLEKESKRLVDILAFCFMPNHFHFLLKQLTDKGISKFMAKITSGFSHYFNIRNDRSGHLFQGNFGAVRVENDEQYLHVSRYIHLNPVAAYLIEIKNLASYEYSSYPEYIGRRSGFTNTKEILSYFKKITEYEKFINDHIDYAKKMTDIERLTLENLE